MLDASLSKTSLNLDLNSNCDLNLELDLDLDLILNSNPLYEFPILKRPIRDKRLAYLDSAATTQKPQCVLNAMNQYYQEENANVHRGVHYLSEIATLGFENARLTVKKFLNAQYSEECIFVKSTTEAINLIASSFGNAFISPDDEILVSMMEHHSNLVPWQMLSQRLGAKIKYISMTQDGEWDLNDFVQKLNRKTKLIAISHASNALGTLHPIKEIIRLAHEQEIPVLVDGAQSAPHLPIDVQDLDCDFFTFSGHKTYGPTGIGVLYGKKAWLEKLPPYQGGGEMIKKVTLTECIYHDLPYKFEAGTPPIASVFGLNAALEFLMSLGFSKIQRKEKKLAEFTLGALNSVNGLQIIAEPKERLGIFSFILEGIHAHDIGTLVDQFGVAIRTGHHCAMPIMDFFGLSATARVSLGLYNTEKDIEQLIEALEYTKRVFKR